MKCRHLRSTSPPINIDASDVNTMNAFPQRKANELQENHKTSVIPPIVHIKNNKIR